jgi:menaquinone-dependent protoporphyrinogen IX oxidase
MKGAVIFHSKYGNCEQVARSIHKGLVDSGAEVTITDVKSAGAPGADLDFIVIGSPTRAGRATGPVRKYLQTVQGNAEKPRFAAFGTGLVRGLDKDAPDDISADYIHKELEKKGLKPLAPPLKAKVNGWKGPVVKGELERAYDYGKELAGGASVGAQA